MPDQMRLAPRLVIAAPQGRSGKTTVTLGLCAVFKALGLAVQPYKKGPDFIDPSWLSEAAGRPCLSLDPFFYDQPEALLWAFLRAVHGSDLGLVEGNHGLFDSFDEVGSGSTAAVARMLKAPILLVVNAARIGRSVAAVVHGCQTFEQGTKISCVVLNNIAGGRHESRLRQAVETYCGVPVVGAIPRDEALTIPDRHLGLVPRGEQERLLPAISACQKAVTGNLDLDMILAIARSAEPLAQPTRAQLKAPARQAARPRIGVLRDRAFSFYYQENFEALGQAGADLVFIDAMQSTELPHIDALYIGGGFPEMFMDELSANTGLRTDIREAVEHDLPVYAECGGLMYLSRRIVWGEKSAEMVGVLPCEVEMTGGPQGHGYVIAEVDNENPFFPVGTVLRGHEFHQSHLLSGQGANTGDLALTTVYRLPRGQGLGNGRDGLVYRNVLATYTHLHIGGAPDWAQSFVQKAQQYQAACLSNEAGSI